MAKLRPNAFKFQIASIDLNIPPLQPGNTYEAEIELNAENAEGELDGWPYFIECALKFMHNELEDVFLLKIPCSVSVALLHNQEVTID